MITVDDRCSLGGCPDKGIYRMVGSCMNCGLADVLILYTAGHETNKVECPTCRNTTVTAKRLATVDEFPEA